MGEDVCRCCANIISGVLMHLIRHDLLVLVSCYDGLIGAAHNSAVQRYLCECFIAVVHRSVTACYQHAVGFCY